MEKRIQIGLVGDFNEKLVNHTAIIESISHARPLLKFSVDPQWIPTDKIDDTFLASHIYEGFWIVPGSPYKNDEGVYKLIRWCRENNFPLLGTCGGFQYMVVEYAKNVRGIREASHQESDPAGQHLIIRKLECSLKGLRENGTITDKSSWLYDVLRTEAFPGDYNCSYGVNPVYQNIINQYPFAFTAFSADGQPRAFELKTHRFFAGTLFQPSLDSSLEKPNKLVISFLNKCLRT